MNGVLEVKEQTPFIVTQCKKCGRAIVVALDGGKYHKCRKM